ncbi:hypothetical protein FGIG_04869 [Fasciola gigantica]|uniref:Uncharacterized protein n=1 Tax=Fasciola gigantica TaxID=46835 RepID=A0A504YWR5_FASGI|nr:hypothetical protein FGIG_04869 [Fasciola gigantica]
MRPRNMILVSAAFVIFGILVLIVGVSLLLASSRYEDPNDVHATVFRISGRITCVTGGILIASTLSTCLYLCIIGAQYSTTSIPEINGTSSQLSKAMQAQTQRRLTTAAGAAGYQWPDNQKFATSQRLSRSLQPKGFLPSGDVTERRRNTQSTEFNWGQPKASLGPLHATNWSNDTHAPCPRLSTRKRGQSADPTRLGIDYIPTLSSKLMMTPTNSLRANSGIQSPRPLWLPNLNNQNTATLNHAPSTEYGTSHLIGQAMEPLGTMLYSGGRVKLGTYV